MIAVKPAMALVTSAFLAFGLGYYFNLAQGYWLVLATLLGLQVSVSATTTRKIFLLAGSAVAASLFIFFTIFLHNVWLAAIFLALTTFIAVAAGLWFTDLWCAVLVVNLFAILAVSFPVYLTAGLQRIVCVIAGYSIAALIQFIFLRRSRVLALRSLLASSLRDLLDLNQTFFSFYLHRDYNSQMFVYEKRLHENRRDFLYNITRAREFLLEQPAYTAVLADIEQIYEIILALGLVLYRVHDHSTFEVAGKEFSALEIAITTALQLLAANLRTGKYGEILGQELPEAIRDMEEVNRNALQVVAADPLVFMLFIQDLTTLDSRLVQLATAIAEVTPQ
jgi:hypothetical protein